MDDFNRKRHAVYKLTYHAVFVIKYRRNVMSEPIIDQMRQCFFLLFFKIAHLYMLS